MGAVRKFVRPQVADNWATDPRTIELQERIEDLEFELAQFTTGHVSEAMLCPWGLGLQPLECKIMWSLANAGGRVLSKDQLAYLAARDPADGGNWKSVAVKLVTLRDAIYPYGIDIETVWGEGLRLSASHCEAWKRWCWASVAGEDPHSDFLVRRSSRVKARFHKDLPERGEVFQRKLRDLRSEGVTNYVIAKKLNVTVATVDYWVARLGLPSRNRGTLNHG